MTKKQTAAELREIAYDEILELFEGDRTAAGKWLSSSVRGLGNHTPISIMGTEPGIQKVRRLVGQLEHGVFP
jgi:putative toxin-antitoxin system antitoxin component (TIGR02293 family)